MSTTTFFLRLVPVYLFALGACQGERQQVSATAEQPVAVTISAVSTGNIRAVPASGNVESVHIAGISTRIMGRITRIYVKAGDMVKKGQLLASISDEDLRARREQASAMIREAEAAAESTQKNFTRFSNLYQQQSATQKELEDALQQNKAAKARLDAAQQMRNEVDASLAYCSIRAPFPGVISQKLAEEGSMASPGMPLLTLEENGILEVSAAVAESDISLIRTGQEADILIKSTGRPMQGRILQINPSSQFTGGQYIVKISLPALEQKELYPGMFASVQIPLKTPAASVAEGMVLVPLSALIYRDGLTGLFTVGNGNRALLRWIRLGKVHGNQAEVISGLSSGEQYILEAQGKLYNGAPVQVRNPS